MKNEKMTQLTERERDILNENVSTLVDDILLSAGGLCGVRDCPSDLVCVRADTGACGSGDMADICPLNEDCTGDCSLLTGDTCSNGDICFGDGCGNTDGPILCPPVVTVQCRNNVIFSNCSTDDKVATRQDYNTNTTFQAFSDDLNKILTTEDYTNNAYDLDNFVRNLGPSNEAILRRNIGRLCMPDETGYFIQ